MKKMLFLAAFASSASIAMAQQPTTKKVDKKIAKKEVKAAKTVATEKVSATASKTKADAESVAPQSVEQLLPLSNQVQPQQISIPQVATQPATPAAPQVDIAKVFEFTNDNYDFGKIVGGKPVEYTVTIKNISKEEATLTYVAPTCGCTTPKYEANKKFAPGESVQVVLGFNGGSPGQASPFSKVVNITLNGNLAKSVTFKGETYVAPAEPAPSNPNLNKF